MLDATVSGHSANSYLTLDQALGFLDDRLDNDAWTSATEKQQEQALILATRLIDNSFEWNGRVTDFYQLLMWPRYAVFTREGREWDRLSIPEPILRAVADLALELLRYDRLQTPELLGLGISSVGVGPIRVTLDPRQVLPYIPQYIINFLMDFGTSRAIESDGGPSTRVLPVLRT